MAIFNRESSIYTILIIIVQKFLNLFNTYSNEENFTSIVYRTLRYNRIKVTFSYVVEYLKSHPDYPSLKSICDFLNEIEVLNYAVRINASELYEINEPFIAYSKESGGKVLLIYSINKELIYYADSHFGKKIEDTQYFLANWSGVVIVIEPTERSGEPDYSEKNKTEIVRKALLPAVIFLIIMVAIFGIIRNKLFTDWSHGVSFVLLLFLIHFIGLFFSFLLQWHELNFKSKFTEKLCHIATNMDCDAVTKSKASKVFGNITWADIGLSYFAGGLLTLCIIPVMNSINNLALFSILALPYPVFSILYQGIKIRKWCPLCLSVQFVLILEFIILFKKLKLNELNLNILIPILVIFSSLFLLELLMKLFFNAINERDYEKIRSLKMKRDPEVFLFKLKKGDRIDIPGDKSALLFGDNQADIFISIFLSFHCSACAKRFNTIKNLISDDSKLKVQLIFFPSKDELSERLLRAILLIFKEAEKKNVLELLKLWYDSDFKTRSEMVNKINKYSNIEEYNDLTSYNSSLFMSGNIKSIPSIYINGYPLPNSYSINDIKYHIPELEKMNHRARIKI